MSGWLKRREQLQPGSSDDQPEIQGGEGVQLQSVTGDEELPAPRAYRAKRREA